MNSDKLREWVCRFVAIEGTLAWAHDEVVVEFHIQSLGNDRVAVQAMLEYHGNYWDNWKEPLTARAEFGGVMKPKSAGSSTTRIEVDQPAPLQILEVDLEVPVVEFLFVTGEPKPLPSFFVPMIELAERQGIEFYNLPFGMRESLGPMTGNVSTSSPTEPTDGALAALLRSAQRAEVRDRALGEHAARILLTVTGHELARLRHAMRLSPGRAGHCMCAGDLELAVLGPDGWTNISLHHGYTMRWKGPWSWHDVAFADPKGFMTWLAHRGVTIYVDMEAEAASRENEQEMQRRRWLAATPECLRARLDALESGALLGGPPPRSPRVEAAIAELRTAVSSTSDVVIALLAWFGSGVGRWSGHPTYERVPEALLVTLGTPQILSGIHGRSLDAAALSGLARYFGSWEYRKERRAELGSVPQELRDQLIAHVRANFEDGEVQRLESAMKAALKTQRKPGA